MSSQYVVSAHPASAVQHAAVGAFTDAAHTNLLVAKTNRIEVHLLEEHALTPMLDVPIRGTVGSMALFRPTVRRARRARCLAAA